MENELQPAHTDTNCHNISCNQIVILTIIFTKVLGAEKLFKQITAFVHLKLFIFLF